MVGPLAVVTLMAVADERRVAGLMPSPELAVVAMAVPVVAVHAVVRA